MRGNPAKTGIIQGSSSALKWGKARKLYNLARKLFTKTPKKKIVKSAEDIEADEINRIYNKFKQNVKDPIIKK